MRLSALTSAATLDRLDCPTDEPCISVKLAFHTPPHWWRPEERLFIPTLISADRYSITVRNISACRQCCARAGAAAGNDPLACADWRDQPGAVQSFVMWKCGASARSAERCFDAWRFQQYFNRKMVAEKWFYPEALERMAGENVPPEPSL